MVEGDGDEEARFYFLDIRLRVIDNITYTKCLNSWHTKASMLREKEGQRH